MTTRPSTCRRFAYALVSSLLCVGAATAASATAEAQARYKQEMQVCDSGQSNQDKATCRTEARNALADARRGGLTAGAPDQLRSNSVQRCSVFKTADDRGDCEARMRANGNIQGSVMSGGILRESVTVVPAK